MSNAPRILIVEDDKDINDLLCDHLLSQGYQVLPALNGTQALEFINQEDFDLYLLDLMIPNINGTELCTHIRSNQKSRNKPIIMLTARSDSESIINGLDHGASDYITKPFDLRELTARVRAQLRANTKTQNNKIIRYQNLSINLESYQVMNLNNEVKLTKSEFLLLQTLLSKPNTVFSRRDLVTKIQGEQTHVTNRTIDTHMASLRKKIGEYSDQIKTIRGIGYKFEV